MQRQRIRQRFTAFNGPQDVEYGRTKLRVRGQFAGDRQSAIQRYARVEERRKFLREEKDVAASSRPKRRKFDRGGLLFFRTDVNRSQALANEFSRHALVALGGDHASAEFAISGNGAVMKGSRRHQSLQRGTGFSL